MCWLGGGTPPGFLAGPIPSGCLATTIPQTRLPHKPAPTLIFSRCEISAGAPTDPLHTSAYQDYFDPSHQMVRDSVRRFVEREMLPGIEQWEEAESFPCELYLKAGAAGILGIGYPEALGGSHEGDLFAKVAASEELMRCGSGGVVAGLGSLDIGLPPVVKWARPEVRERVAPQVLAGEKIKIGRASCRERV